MLLSIVDKESQQPLLTLSQDDQGLKVAGGDSKLVQALKLNQFSDLKEIADYINSSNANLEAVFEEEDQEQAGDQENAGFDERIQPALTAVKELMAKVKARKDQEQAVEQADKPENQILTNTDSQVVYSPGDWLYISLDGDNIGNAVARAEEKDDEQELRAMSARINAGQDILRNWAIRLGGLVVEQGGDEGLVKVPSQALKEVERLRQEYYSVVGATASVGVGKKISESTKARMLAKLKGKNRTEIYNDDTPKELELRLQDKDETESNKIRTAMQDPSYPQDVITPDQAQPQQQQPEQPVQEPQPHEGPNTDDFKQEEAGPGSNVMSAPMSPDLMKAMQDHYGAQEPKSDMFASALHDPEIEQADYSYSEDPQFSKSLRYAAKYGDKS